MAELKFCGMTRSEDVRAAADLGAGFVGVIFAGGPRHQSLESAKRLFADAPATLTRVGVVGDQPAGDIAALVQQVGLNVVQLHADPPAERIREVRAATGVVTWAVVRIAGSTLPAIFQEVAEVADGIVLDARSASGLGGTGITLPWVELARSLAPRRAGIRLILAGGLRADNVGEAIAAIKPDIVDVSSGVESAPGIKDHEQMRAFRDAVRRATI